MRRIPIYKEEVNAGLADKIIANASVAYLSVAALAPEIAAQQLKYIQTNAKLLSRATNENQIDLHYLKSILATIGWNKNDDVFDRIETWVARSTPEDKPFNYEHNARDIIGHITGNYAVDFDGKILPDDAPVDDLPEKFHIATSSVLYKYWPEKELADRMQTIIAEIAENKWFISMEALFDNFDYAIIGSDGKNYVIARNEESSFLTKHLRAYGGDGKFEDKKVGRLLRNIVFSGKGLVRKPANSHSVIFDNVLAFEKAVASSVQEFKKIQSVSGYTLGDRQNSNQEKTIMAGENIQLELLQKENDRLVKSVDAAVAKVSETEKRLAEMNEQAVKAKVDGLSAEVKSRDEKITSLNNQVKTEQDARTLAETKVKELEGKLVVLQEQVSKANSDRVKASRVAVITTELNKSQEDAVKLFETLADLSDDKFTALIASLKPTQQKSTETGEKKTPEQIALEAAASAQAALQNGTPDKTAPLGSTGVTNNVEQTRVSFGKFLGQRFLSVGKIAK